MGIALRRHHVDRLKNNRKNYWGRDLTKEPKYHSMVVDTPKTFCNCGICRIHKPKTVRDLKEDILLKESKNEKTY